MCSFYWSHRLGPLQPVIRLQAWYPLVLVLALPHPHPLVHRPVEGVAPARPRWCQHRGATPDKPPSICCVFLSLWPCCPRYRTYSSPLRSFHPSHLQAQQGYNEPYSEARAMGQLCPEEMDDSRQAARPQLRPPPRVPTPPSTAPFISCMVK